MNAPLLTEEFHLLAAAPNGVKKLRELILSLAVRGKLVAQDSKDEPAAELLKRITAEKAKLIAVGKLKSNGLLPSIAEDETPFVLPVGWEWSRLGVAALINPRNSADDGDEVSFVPMTMITTGFDGAHAQERRKWNEVKQGFTHFAEGDIGVAKITPCFENSKAAVFTGLANGIGAGTTELHIVRPIARTLLPRYVLAYLKSPMFLSVGETKMTGTAGQKRLPKDFVEANPFPLPPLAEQHRIVAKVDELMALCDQLEAQQTTQTEAHERLVATLLDTLTQSADAAAFADNWSRIAEHFDLLFDTPESIDKLKQSILQLAVQGKLETQEPNDEPASDALKRIAVEKARLVAEGQIKKEAALAPVSPGEVSFALPIGWAWTRMQCAFDVRDGTHDTPKYVERDGIPLITSKNFVEGRISFEDVKLISREDHESIKKRSGVTKGDILYSMIGGNIGNQVFVDTDREFSIKNVALFKYYSAQNCSGQFLNLLLKTVTSGIQRQAVGGAQPFVSLSFLRNIPIPFPPLAEQHRIVAKVDELMAVCDALAARLSAARELSAKLAATVAAAATA